MTTIRSIIIVCFIFISSQLQAQWEYRGVVRSQSQHARILANESDTLSLPFREDFAEYTGKPNPAKWLDSDNVFIDPAIAINPPNIHVASLDGLTANGDPYRSELGKGPADILQSRAFDLDGYTEADSVYLSFYWQIQGLGEAPEADDELVVQFKNQEGEWVNIRTVNTDLPGASTMFTQEFIHVSEPYLYKGFQFRLVAICDLNGRFDVWNIDYIVLDRYRSRLSRSHNDSGLSTYPGPILADFYSVPVQHLKEFPTRFTSSGNRTVRFQSLKNSPASEVLSFSAILLNNADSGQLYQLHNSAAFTSFNFTFPINLASVNANLLVNYLEDQALDSIALILKVYSTDPNQDFFHNDTLNAAYTLYDYYALDDGTAEYAGGVRSSGVQIAMKYGIPGEGLLTHVDIAFINYEGSSGPFSIDLVVWKSNNGLPGDELSRTRSIVQRSTELNGFTSYKLESPVFVEQDSVFIGYEQLEDGLVYIGIDRNTTWGTNLYSRSQGNWVRNTNSGTPMMRPRFSQEIISALPEKINTKKPVLYPNPTQRFVQLPKGVQNLKLLDMGGKQYWVPAEQGLLDMQHVPVGIYLLSFTFEGNTYSSKIIKQ